MQEKFSEQGRERIDVPILSQLPAEERIKILFTKAGLIAVGDTILPKSIEPTNFSKMSGELESLGLSVDAHFDKENLPRLTYSNSRETIAEMLFHEKFFSKSTLAGNFILPLGSRLGTGPRVEIDQRDLPDEISKHPLYEQLPFTLSKREYSSEWAAILRGVIKINKEFPQQVESLGLANLFGQTIQQERNWYREKITSELIPSLPKRIQAEITEKDLTGSLSEAAFEAGLREQGISLWQMYFEAKKVFSKATFEEMRAVPKKPLRLPDISKYLEQKTPSFPEAWKSAGENFIAPQWSIEMFMKENDLVATSDGEAAVEVRRGKKIYLIKDAPGNSDSGDNAQKLVEIISSEKKLTEILASPTLFTGQYTLYVQT